MITDPELHRAGRVAAMAVDNQRYPTMHTAIEVIPHTSMAMNALDRVESWLQTEGGQPLTPERLRAIAAEFIGACVQQDVDPFAVIPHMHACCQNIVGRWRQECERRWNYTAFKTPTTTRRAS